MEFLTFPKISTNSGKTGLAAPGNAWVAQEKVHGAQLVIAVSSDEVRIGKRKTWLNEQDAFFGWQLIRNELQVLCSEIYRGLSFPAGTIAYFYGELFGGKYPHPDVKSEEGIQAIQTGIWYSPLTHWMIFDAVILPKGTLDNAFFLGSRELASSIQSAGGICAPVLGRGPINDLLRLPVRFRTQIPSLFNLPEISGNWAEGLVIKPESATPISERSVIKRKIEEFDENRFDESEAWKSDQLLSLNGLKLWVSKMVNPARLASARSKVGDGCLSALIEEVVLDTLVDLEAAFPATFQALQTPQEEELKRFIAEQSARIRL